MTGDELAARLARNLEHLALIRECAARLFARDRLGRDFFARGQLRKLREPTGELPALLDAMRRVQSRNHHGTAIAERRGDDRG